MKCTCAVCSRTFSRMGDLNRHMASALTRLATLASVVKSSVVKMLDSAIKELVLSDQTLNSCNLNPAWPVSRHPRQAPYPPYPG